MLSGRFRSACVAVTVLTLPPMLAGCGVMLGGTSQTVQLSTSPPGASLETVPQSAPAITPASVKLDRKHSYTLRFSLEGYEPATAQIDRKIRKGILVADILLCCLAPVIDAVTGGWYKLTPEIVSVNMVKTGAGPGPDRVHVGLTVNQASDGANVQVESSIPGVAIEIIRR